MEEFIASSGLVIVEIAIVLIIVLVVAGVILRRKSKGNTAEAKNFVKNINANVSQRKEKHLEFAKQSFGEHLDELEIAAHVELLLEKENSLYGKFVKVVMHHEGHALEHVSQYVDDLIKACHIKLPEKDSKVSEQVDIKLHEELIQTLREENDDLRYKVEKLTADNGRIMGEYEIIYEKHEALEKQGVA
ncbi:MAG: hypothetical protein COC09_09310 [Gammaproteobacteria bacterium]|nr:hypothetical protein [Gammaproteobacteria bacterium]PCH62172.1 MAG: hypothetical protein COC09_09310 [Gammaproteobacteria bacterium]